MADKYVITDEGHFHTPLFLTAQQGKKAEQRLILDWLGWHEMQAVFWFGPGILTFDRLSDWSIARLRSYYPLLAEAA